MSRHATELNEREKGWVAAAVTAVAGFVDAVGYILLVKLFVAHMTGNTVAAALSLTDGNWQQAFHRGYPIPVFVAGLMLSEFVLEHAKRKGRHRLLCRVLALEAIFLAAFIVCGVALARTRTTVRDRSISSEVVLTTLATLAMGVQNASLRRVGALTIFTTHVTGTLTKLGTDAVCYLFWFHDRTAGRWRRRWRKVLRISPRQVSFRATAMLAVLWATYFLAAALGAWGVGRWGAASLVAPLIVILTVIAFDVFRPISPLP